MKQFDFYEFTGILTPGVILLYAVSLTVPAVTPFMTSAQLSVGDLGLFIRLAYVARRLVQGLGYLIMGFLEAVRRELVWWTDAKGADWRRW